MLAATQKNIANGRIRPSGEFMFNEVISQAALGSLKIRSGLERTLRKGNIADNVNNSAAAAKIINKKHSPSLDL